MSFSSEITARLGLDTQGFSEGLKKAKSGVETFADGARNTLARKLGGADVFRGLLQGLGIGSAQQIADLLVKPFRQAAEEAQKLAAVAEQAMEATLSRMRGRATLENQVTLAIKEREGLERELVALSNRSSLSSEQRLRLEQLKVDIARAENTEKALGERLEAKQRAEFEARARSEEQQREESAKWFAERAAAVGKERAAAEAAAAAKKEAEEKVNATLREQRAAREALANNIRAEAELARQKGEIEAENARRLADFQREQDARALREQLGSEGLGRTEFLVDGRRIAGQARSRAEFDQASPEALREFIRRQSLTVGQIQGNFGRGEQALTDVVTGGLVRNLAASVLQTEIGFARDRLRDFNRFAGADRRTALRDFDGDPLAFDRLFESSQRNFEAADRAAAGIERLTRLFETGAARSSSVITGASPGVFPPRG